MTSASGPRDHELAPDDWLAFVLSLALPGAGQLWKGNATGLWWMLSAALLLTVWGLLYENLALSWPVMQYGSFILLCLTSAWHARHCRRGF